MFFKIKFLFPGSLSNVDVRISKQRKLDTFDLHQLKSWLPQWAAMFQLIFHVIVTLNIVIDDTCLGKKFLYEIECSEKLSLLKIEISVRLFVPTVKLGYNEQLGTGHCCSL